ncbi:MAG: antibiotic biosynthesis monooxygenase [Actinomycetota bacterium]|nr:antibiotic biosynthesis monooxygenase [Actinomycetota bacterium]
MIIRIFDTAMEPDDIDKAKEFFRDDVRPAFESFPGCHGVEMTIGVEEHSGDLVDVASLSRWDSIDAVNEATATDEYKEALARIRQLFRQAPIVRHFELVE